jgi:hypothetical protein
MSSFIPLRFIYQEIQHPRLRNLFTDSEVREAVIEGTTPEGLCFRSTRVDDEVWVDDLCWEAWRKDRLDEERAQYHVDIMEETENLQYRHAQKVAQRRREDC